MIEPEISHVYPNINKVVFLNAVKRLKYFLSIRQSLGILIYFLVPKFQKSDRGQALKFSGWRKLKSN